ncbi:MAG: hypothetical protein IRZ14_09565 [Chloroflexi bacterium]|nr:hypothetical protein [Chloroflexota bacterium]
MTSTMARPPRPRAARGLATEHAPPLDLPLRFLLVALGGFAVLGVTAPWHLPLLLGSFYDPHLLTFVHVNTLGIIAATVFGASYQLVPVVLQTALPSARVARLSWWLYLPGVLALLAGLSGGLPALLGLGGSLLAVAILLYAGVLLGAFWRAAERDVIFWHLAVALAGLVLAAGLGTLLAHSKYRGLLGASTLPVLATHAVLMVAGWVTPLITGVAYRLVGMFTLSEDQLRPGWAGAELALTAGGAWLLAASLLGRLGSPANLIGAGALCAGQLLFGLQLLRLYRLRRRRSFDVHIPFALAACTAGLLASGLVVVGLATARPPADPVWMTAGWLAIVGWAETAIQGFLYKIGPFLTWLHRYAPLAGRQPVPRLEDLYGRRTALLGWACWVSGVALGALAALTQVSPLASMAGGLLSVGLAAFLVNAVRTGAHWRPFQPLAGRMSAPPGPAAR